MARYKRIRKKGTITEPDEFLTFWERQYEWAMENWEKLLTPLLIVMLAVVVGGGFFYYTQQKASSAQNELTLIMNAYPRGADTNPAVLAEVVTALTEFSQRFSGTDAASVADLYEAHTVARQTNSVEAVKLYEKIISSGKTNELIVSMAVLSLARLHQDQGSYEKSNTTLEKFSAGKSSAFVEEIDFMSAQNMELASNKKAALEKYHAFLTKHPDSTLSPQARKKIQGML